jgi:hypothetical protein
MQKNPEVAVIHVGEAIGAGYYRYDEIGFLRDFKVLGGCFVCGLLMTYFSDFYLTYMLQSRSIYSMKYDL